MCLIWIQALSYVSEIQEKRYSKKKYRHFHFHSWSFPNVSNLRQFLLAPLSFGSFIGHKDKIKYQGSQHRHECVFPKPLVCMCVLSRFSCAWLFVTPWTVAHQASLFMGFSRLGWVLSRLSGLSYPPPGDLTDPGIEPTSLMSLALAVRFFTTSTTWEVSQSLLLDI